MAPGFPSKYQTTGWPLAKVYPREREGFTPHVEVIPHAVKLEIGGKKIIYYNKTKLSVEKRVRNRTPHPRRGNVLLTREEIERAGNLALVPMSESILRHYKE